MTVKSCVTCKHVTDFNIGDKWCLLVDEPVKKGECCESWTEKDDRVRIYDQIIEPHQNPHLLEMWKRGIKQNPVTKKCLNRMVADDLSEEDAVKIMVTAYFSNF